MQKFSSRLIKSSIKWTNVAIKRNHARFALTNIESSTVGTLGMPDFKLYFHNATTKEKVSLWHDIPYKVDTGSDKEVLFHYIHEISRGERRKMELNTSLPHNPITQDVSKGKLRLFTYGDLPFNYGCIPQTWEDPNSTSGSISDLKGDNDPVDVVEISSTPLQLGKIYAVKVLGVVALIDQGEVDWKVLAIRNDDPTANELNDINDLINKRPKALEDVFHWFRYYKTTDGKPENVFALDGEAMNTDFARAVIEETHEKWSNLIKLGSDKLWLS